MLPVHRIDEAQAEPAPHPEWFTGRVQMQNLAPDLEGIELLAVFFDADAHTRPHIHPTDQALIFVRGNGFVVFPGEERQRVEEGEIVVVPAGLLHMHGATEGEPICHIATRAPGPTNWQPDVPDEWRRYMA